MTDIVDQLRALRRRHGDTPLGNRFSNLARKMTSRSACQDPTRSAAIEKNIRCDIAEIVVLSGRQVA